MVQKTNIKNTNVSKTYAFRAKPELNKILSGLKEDGENVSFLINNVLLRYFNVKTKWVRK